MLPDGRDAAYLWDMVDAAQAIVQFTMGLTLDGYLQDRKVQFAVERALEIIGEAAHHVSTAFKQAHPDIPWRSIVAQRNVLAHGYGAIKHDRIYMVAMTHAPQLVAALQPWLPQVPRAPGE